MFGNTVTLDGNLFQVILGGLLLLVFTNGILGFYTGSRDDDHGIVPPLHFTLSLLAFVIGTVIFLGGLITGFVEGVN